MKPPNCNELTKVFNIAVSERQFTAIATAKAIAETANMSLTLTQDDAMFN